MSVNFPKSTKKAVVALALVVATLFFYRTQYEVPILMYHHVSDELPASSVVVTPETFEKQMEFLKVHRYHVADLSELIQSLKSHQPLKPNTVVITFDDGNLDNFTQAFPVLKKMGFPATIFMITDNIGKEGWLGEEDLRILDESGISIGSHTVHHAFLPAHEMSAVKTELAESKKRLEDLLGHPVTLFSYPAGGVTDAIELAVQEAGYEGAVTTNYGRQRHQPYRLHRIKVSESRGSLANFWIKTSGLYHVGKKRVQALLPEKM